MKPRANPKPALDLQTRLQELVDDWEKTDRAREVEAANLDRSEAAWTKEFPELTVTDSTALSDSTRQRAELDLRRRHFDADFRRRALFDQLLLELNRSAGMIRDIAQPRHSDENVIFECFWRQRLALMGTQTRENQIRSLREIAAEVLGNLRTLLGQKRPIILSQEERQRGVLKDGVCVVRKLTHEEILSGEVFE